LKQKIEEGKEVKYLD